MPIEFAVVRFRHPSCRDSKVSGLPAIAAALLLTSQLYAGNFVCSDTEIVRMAEAARVRSAQFWSDGPLPGEWFIPCPIQVFPASHSGGGRTQFRFEGGEVFGWRMEVTGTREALLRDVIPHEVDHMVRASLIRRPLERWLDEGCATLMESPESHQGLRRVAAGLSPGLIQLDWLERDQYPQSTQEIRQLYALGFSLVEYLLTQGSPANLLEFQRDSASLTVRLQRHYNMNVAGLRSGWEKWINASSQTSCRAGRCLLHPAPAAPALVGRPQPLLIVWTADWCAACRQFKRDYAEDVRFRTALDSAFTVRIVDFDQQQAEATAQEIQTLPTFIMPERRITGYLNPTDLLPRLQVPGQESSAPAPTVLPTTPITLTPATSATPPKEELPPPPIPTSPASAPAREHTQGHGWKILQWVPVTLSALQWAGLIGGSVATGGVGGMALAAAMLLFKLRPAGGRSTSSTVVHSPVPEEGGVVASSAPFPRQLDEAGELLELRQTEGRVATLDTLRGMFLDDELEKLEQTGPAAAQLVVKLRKAIDARVDEVAPLTTKA